MHDPKLEQLHAHSQPVIEFPKTGGGERFGEPFSHYEIKYKLMGDGVIRG